MKVYVIFEHPSYVAEVRRTCVSVFNKKAMEFKTSLTFKCLIEHLLADFSYSRPLDTYLWKQMMKMNRNITYKWCNIMERHNWHLMLNIDEYTTSYIMYCPYFFIRSILNIMCDCLNTLCCSFLITRSGFVIMRCRSYKWCSSLIITCCAFINWRATCYFMYSRYNIIRSIPLIIRCSKFITCCGYIFQ